MGRSRKQCAQPPSDLAVAAAESLRRAMSVSHDVHALRPRLYEDVVADVIGNGAWHVHRITGISRWVLELEWDGGNGNLAEVKIPLQRKFEKHRLFWRDAKTGRLHYCLENWEEEDYHA